MVHKIIAVTIIIWGILFAILVSPWIVGAEFVVAGLLIYYFGGSFEKKGRGGMT